MAAKRKAKRTGGKKAVPAVKVKKAKAPLKAKSKKKKPKPEPRHAGEEKAEPIKPIAGVSEEEFDEEIESIGDGTDDTEPLHEDEILDEEDDEGYF